MRSCPALLAVLFLLAGLVDAQETSLADLKRGKWKRRHAPKGFSITRVGRYQLQSNCDPALMKRVGRHMNRMFKVYARHFPYKKTPTGQLVIKIFKTREQFVQYGRTPGAAAYFSPTEKEMVGYNTGKVDGEMQRNETGKRQPFWREAMTFDLLGVFSHEGWHQFFHWSSGSIVPFPAWCDEGIGEYYNSAWHDGKDFVIGAPNDYRLAVVQSAIARNKHVPLEELIHFEQRDYYRNADLCYAEGWSLVHFFFEHPDYKKKKYVQRFVKIFQDQHSIKKTIKQLFGKKFDWKKVEEDWKSWVMAIPPPPRDKNDERDESPAIAFRGDLMDRMLGNAKRAEKYRSKLSEPVRRAIDDVVGRRRTARKEK